MLNIVLFGPPGSGKGTQANLLIDKYGLKHLSTGDLLRAERKAKTELGLEAQKFIDAGELVPDAVVIGMIEKAYNQFKENVNGFIFDGFPRTQAQAIALDELLTKMQAPIKSVLFLQVEVNELVGRLLERGKTSGRADDQNEEVIRNRQKVYNDQTAVVGDFYGKQSKVVNINGQQSIEQVHADLCTEIEKLC